MFDYPQALEIQAAACDQAHLTSHIRGTVKGVLLGMQTGEVRSGDLMSSQMVELVHDVLADVEPSGVRDGVGTVGLNLHDLINKAGLAARAWSKRFADLPVVWVSPEAMSEDANHVAPEVPTRQHVPFVDGCLFVFAQPPEGFNPRLCGVAWWPVGQPKYDDRFKATLLWRSSEDAVRFARGVTPAMMLSASFGEVMSDDALHVPAGAALPATEAMYLVGHLLRLVARDPNHADTADVRIAVTPPDKAGRRLAKKRHLAPEVNVLYLSTEKAALGLGASRTGATGGRSHHRVRAHWRWQPYGPGRRLRRWVLVSEHERGDSAHGSTKDVSRVHVAGRAGPAPSEEDRDPQESRPD